MHPVPTGRSRPPSVRLSGASVVVGMMVLGVSLAAFALAFQRWQTARCLGFYGAGVSRAITTAPHVEVWHLVPGAGPGRLAALGRCDVSRAPGLVHLRRGLVEDANFDWGPRAGPPRPAEAWRVAIAFGPVAGAMPTAILAVGEGDGGELCVVGRAGRVGLGRLGQGLRTWIDATCPDGGRQGRQ